MSFTPRPAPPEFWQTTTTTTAITLYGDNAPRQWRCPYCNSTQDAQRCECRNCGAPKAVRNA